MSGTSVWTLENVAPFWLNKFSLCCLDESSVDIVDICFYCHPHCMLSMCGVWRSLCGGTGPDNHYNGLMAGAGVGAKGSGVHTDTLNTLPGTLHCSRYLDRGTPHSDTLIWIGRWQTTPTTSEDYFYTIYLDLDIHIEYLPDNILNGWINQSVCVCVLLPWAGYMLLVSLSGGMLLHNTVISNKTLWCALTGFYYTEYR